MSKRGILHDDWTTEQALLLPHTDRTWQTRPSMNTRATVSVSRIHPLVHVGSRATKTVRMFVQAARFTQFRHSAKYQPLLATTTRIQWRRFVLSGRFP